MILVTGATGLVGSHLLVKLLQENEVVKALYRNKENIEKVRNVFRYKNQLNLFDKINWIEGNINDIPSLNKAFENIRQVYHCAALISFDPNDEEELRKTNIEGTANIVNCCIDFKVDKLCYISSIAALGDAKENEYTITEETEWNSEKFHSDYAISKYGAEMEIWRGFQEGLKVVILNPGVIFGYGFPKQGSSAFFNSIKKGLAFYTKGKIGIVAVEDVVNCAVILTNKNYNGQRYTIVSENITLESILFTIADAMNTKRPFLYANKTVTNIACKLDWLLSKITGRKRGFTKTSSKSSHSTTIYSNSKITETLDYNFLDMTNYLTLLSQEF
ncbi:NAD-dependent epimerase [Flavobacterium sp. 316]|uniref:NAD-dependent epimerase/dehydratase family protein n=1 Tax=Flavobacterium sp. 316 TaxID=1603293 RepID=UPI0005E60CF3|nr:NAD-dependent epimerase/dehydratase family protein [Flavobacterium sp. 316]KIX21040.1 NAD-dependent epimerase [Flavobacterium sp. 316]